MKINKWTLGLAALGVVSLASAARAEEGEAKSFVETALTTTTLSGYIDTAAVWKFGSGNHAMPGRVYDGRDVQDGFNLNVVSLTLEKPLDESEWAAGYRVQMLFGPGASKRGGASIIGGGSDVSFNEAVILLRVPVGNGLDLKVGQFGTFNGYEAYDTYKNPNWSRSYGFALESSTHTGIAASYTVCDWLSFMAGIANNGGFNNAVDARAEDETRKAYLAMMTLTAPESFGVMAGSTLSIGYTVGDATGAPGAAGAAPASVNVINSAPSERLQHNFYAGLSMPTPIEGLSLGLAYDYTAGIGAPAAPVIATEQSSYANAVAAYVVFQATEKLKLANRFDYTWATEGVFYGSTDADSDPNELFSWTVTADYSLWANVISRLEFRWDTCLSGDKPFGGRHAAGTGDKHAVSMALNLIYQF